MIALMPSAFRRLLACLLLVLLPFQAMAAGVAACNAAGRACSEPMMQMMDCCDHGDQSSPELHCGTAFGCMSAAAPALLPDMSVPVVLSQPRALALAPVQFHDSFIPDGPQRPPRPLS
ncbi:hypothetical protein IV454_24570 [Massilia antarctica]|uniref:Uncharacterized protein n=1 Tax=Massilia antarctica TaxID=2765360 RepID=A0AA48WBX8_9BURK|nr:hypothetical protein [Massilia antarctica]QPI48669.1 hypothetical protein IV454_24570 [Massilia antarctica]